MVKALGIDPGTKSFDLAVIEGDEVRWESSIPTEEVARNPESLIDLIKSAGGVDVIAAPSGYGSPVIWGDELRDPETFALEILLLTPRRVLEEGFRRGEVGIGVYKALAEAVKLMVNEFRNVCFIPSVILLPTIPLWRKLNRLDMGTADKLAVTVLAIHNQSVRLGVKYDEVSFILIEMGYGYNAVVGVDGGKVVDGLGGTLTPMGFLTSGPLDLELVVAGESWVRTDVFHGGVSEVCGTTDLGRALALAEEGVHPCVDAFKAMFEWVERGVRGMLTSVPNPREIILSGRLIRYDYVRSELIRRLSSIAPVRRLEPLKGASVSKEAAQGYALIAEGLAGGFFKELVNHVEIPEARGTVADYVTHPRLLKFRNWLREALRRSVREDVFNRVKPVFNNS